MVWCCIAWLISGHLRTTRRPCSLFTISHRPVLSAGPDETQPATTHPRGHARPWTRTPYRAEPGRRAPSHARSTQHRVHNARRPSLAWQSRRPFAGSRRGPHYARRGRGPANRSRNPVGMHVGARRQRTQRSASPKQALALTAPAAPQPHSHNDQPHKTQKQHPTPPALRPAPPHQTADPPHLHAEKPSGTMYTLHEHAGPPGYMGHGMQARRARNRNPGPAKIGAPRHACRGVRWSLARALQEHARRSCSCCSRPTPRKFVQPQGTRDCSARRSSSAQRRQRRHGSHDVEQEGGHVGEGDQALHAARGRVHDEQPPHARHRQPLHHGPARRADLLMIGFRVRIIEANQALGEKLQGHKPARQKAPASEPVQDRHGMAHPVASVVGSGVHAPERVARRADVDALQLGRRDAACLCALADARSTCQQCTCSVSSAPASARTQEPGMLMLRELTCVRHIVFTEVIRCPSTCACIE